MKVAHGNFDDKRRYDDDDDDDDDDDVSAPPLADASRRILYDHYLPTVILIIIGIPSPTHSFTLGLNPSYRSLSFFSFRIHYMDFPDCLLLLLSISVFLLFSFFPVFTLF